MQNNTLICSVKPLNATAKDWYIANIEARNLKGGLLLATGYGRTHSEAVDCGMMDLAKCISLQ